MDSRTVTFDLSVVIESLLRRELKLLKSKVFRPNVAVIVVNAQGLILACHRADKIGVWQLPQGGVDEGETELETLYRELQEEVGTRDVDVIGQLSEKIRYDWPPKHYHLGFHGQEQTYFLVRLRCGAVINLSYHSEHIEFDECEWVTANEFISRLSGFKKPPYVKAISMLIKEFPNVIAE